MESPSSQLAGAVFNGRWKLTRLVGEGGMGAVFEAQGLHGEGVRAIKVLHTEFTAEQQILTRFFAEAQAVQMLRHPNVAQIFEAQRAEDGTPYLVMEFLSGMPLSGLMHPGVPVPPVQALPIVQGVLQALAHAHGRGIIHRDLKPDNLFLISDGQGNRVVKVLDFGIAKVMDAAGGMGSKTKTGVLLGTPGYMSPEQIKNSKAVDPRSDLWSVGVILYEMLTGREAFPADNEFARLSSVLSNEILPIAQINPALSNWSGFFGRALSKDPQGRYQNAEEMLQALNAVTRAGSPTMGSPQTQGSGKPTRDWGTVAISAPMSSQAPYATPGGQMPQSMHSPQSLQQQSLQQQSLQQQSLQQPSMQRPQPSIVEGERASVPVIAPFSRAAPSSGVPGQSHPSQPPGPNSGPVTHVSGQRPPGVPTFTGNTPQVPVLLPPPMSYPLWVLIAVGVGAFVVGLTIGLLAH